MRESSPIAAAVVLPVPMGTALPTDHGQNHTRPLYRQGGTAANILMLIAAAALWAATWWAAQTILSAHPPAISPRSPYAALPVESGKPELLLSLAPEAAPAASPSPRLRQRVSTDLLTLLGHVTRSILKDEFDTMVLRLSLGEQVALHLRQSWQNQQSHPEPHPVRSRPPEVR